MSESVSLFSGTPSPFGGLSNEDELSRSCPPQFKRSNPWSEYAMHIFFMGGKTTNWKWKTDDSALRGKQLGCFKGLLGSFGPKHEDKEAVAGWMLSEMLEELPK